MSNQRLPVAVVTGGGDGIGRALALSLAMAGFDIAVLDIRGAAAEAVAAEIRAHGRHALAIACDVSATDALEQAASHTVRELGGVNLVWANAGLGIAEGFIKARRSNLEWMYAVNVMGTIDTVRAFVPAIRQQRGARFIGITGSMAGITHADPGNAAYCASKYAVVGIAEALHAELASEGFQVSCLCPGLVNTAIWNGARARPERFGGARQLPDSVGERWRRDGMDPLVIGEQAVRGLLRGDLYIVLPDGGRAEAIKQRNERLLQSVVKI